MPDFTTTQADLHAARSAFIDAQLAATRAAEAARQAQAALDRAKRHQKVDDPHAAAQLNGLQAQAERAAEARAAAARQFSASRASVSAASAAFANFNDPRRAAAELDSETPFLLFPVRIETRFRNTAGNPAGIAVNVSHELLVRIYPDDCSIDTFEPDLSASELANVKSYWMNIWRAGGVEPDERGAWANLVRAHGSGRAGFLADHFQPTNLSAKPVKAQASDEILVIPANAALPATDATAISAYWQAYWLADGDAARETSALNALKAAVGAARASDLIANYAPFNIGDKPAPPAKKSSVAVSVAFVLFPPDPPTKLQTWSLAPQVRQFPDRFIVLGFNGGVQTLAALGGPITLPLYTGPDPGATESEGIHPEGEDLFIPSELEWLVDFDVAVAAGMGIRIPLTPDQAAHGFERLLVIGLQLSTAPENGPAALGELLSHHQWSRSGFEFLAQGARAHNSSGADSAYTKDDDADASFDDRKNAPLFTPTTDPNLKRDGQWFAEWLGLNSSYVATVHGSGRQDQMHARATQRALWPATFGYWMNTLFTPGAAKTSIFSDDVIDQTRAFICEHVSGRGALPAIRIGGQPYGILPTTVFSRIQWFTPRFEFRDAVSETFLSSLYGVLRQIDADWTAMSKNVSTVAAPGPDPHQTLLDVLAHHASSVEWYSRTAESAAQLYNMFNFWALAPQWWQAILQLGLQAEAIALLQRFGYNRAELPDLLNHFYLSDNPRISTIIDDRPLSDKNPIRAYTPDGRNYIQWLIDAASASLDTLRNEPGFTNNQSPQALLYLYLRHALMLGYYDSSYRFHRDLNIVDATGLLSMRVEPAFVHVAESPGTSESRFAALYKTESRITGSPNLLVSDFIREKIGLVLQTAELADQIEALKVLVNATTAELERLFAEHIDICSYRYDAWLLGLVHLRLKQLRAPRQENAPGLCLGAYAWVENLKPAPSPVPAQPPQNLAGSFPAPLLTDPAGGGYIHAPSMQHADTAAILRSGYIANRDSADPNALAVNLSSDRVRVALSLIEGIRNGQSLGALLGYQFERGLHDAHNLTEVDSFIYPLRKAFPLAADSLAPTKTDSTVPIEAVEARNVLDGKKLLDQVRKNNNNPTYPYGLATLKPVTLPAQQIALDTQTRALLDAYDAIADLALAESVHQAVQGNFDRVASTIEAYTTGNFPPEPMVVQTPPSGITLTHRFALHLKPGITPPPTATPRAQTEPAVDHWLKGMLPALDQIRCAVKWTDPVTGTPQTHHISLADLKLEPIDVLFLLKPDNAQAMAEMDDRISRFVQQTWKPRPDATITIEYLDAGAGHFSIFETGALVRHLRTLVTQSRPLKATDASRSNDASNSDNAQVFTDKTRVSIPFTGLQTLATDIVNFVATLTPLPANPLADLDANTEKATVLLERAARFNVPQSGWGFLNANLRGLYSDLLKQVADLDARWNQKLLSFKAALNAYDLTPPPTDAEKFAALQAAELIIASELDPLPASPAALRLALNAKKTAFQNRLNDFTSVLGTSDPSFANLYAAVNALATAPFDSQPFDISSYPSRAAAATADIVRGLTAVSSAIAARLQEVSAALTAYDAASSPSSAASSLQTAAKAMLGEDFFIVPEFAIPSAQQGEWLNAYNESIAGTPFTYLKTTRHVDFPVDEWMYQIARIRPVFRSWESAVMLSTAFALTPPAPVAAQFPYVAGASWLALEYPPDEKIDSDRLLYTALYSEPFNPGVRQCGLLLDDWTEVIPSPTRDTALTFQFSRPDNEPPQSMLLVTSPAISGTWQWQDLVDALNETLDLAKKRAVEPAQLDPTVYSRFLPATVTASTRSLITISMNLMIAGGLNA